MDWLFSEVKLGQPEPDNNNTKNYCDTLRESQVPLFTTIRSSTAKLNDNLSVALEEGGDREMCVEIGGQIHSLTHSFDQ